MRNEVLHGPVLGLSGFGIARVNTHLVLSDETRKEIAEIFGPKDPLEVSTRVGFLGGGTTTFTSEGRTIKPDDGKTEISWETFKLAIGYSRNADKYDMDGKWPKLEFKGLEDKTHFVMNDMTLDGDGKRVRGDLYDGDFTFAIDKHERRRQGRGHGRGRRPALRRGRATPRTTSPRWAPNSEPGAVKSKQLSAIGVELKEIHYDFSVRRLHAETLEKMLADIKAAYATPLTSALEARGQVMFAPFKEKAVRAAEVRPGVRHRSHRHRDARRRWLHQGRDHAQGRDGG